MNSATSLQKFVPRGAGGGPELLDADLHRLGPPQRGQGPPHGDPPEGLDEGIRKIGQNKRLLESELVLTFARDLLAFQDSAGFKTPGYESMPKYCKGALHLGASTTRYYLQIAKFMKEKASRVSWAKWVALGPTKIRVLAAVDPNLDELVGLVHKYTSANISTRRMKADLLRGSPEDRTKQ